MTECTLHSKCNKSIHFYFDTEFAKVLHFIVSIFTSLKRGINLGNIPTPIYYLIDMQMIRQCWQNQKKSYTECW
jgi:hypothetical protein